MMPVKFIAVILGIVFFAGQSYGQFLPAFSDALQSLQNNPDVQACMAFDAVCDQNFQSQVQNIQSPLHACPAIREYLNCFAASCNLDPEVKKMVFSTIEEALRSGGVECVISNGQDSSMQPDGQDPRDGQDPGAPSDSLSDAFQSLQNNSDIQACIASATGCGQTFQSQIQNIQSPSEACPAIRGYLNCFANFCNLHPEVRKLVFSTTENTLKNGGVECDLDNGQPSIQKCGPGFILMAMLVTFRMFFF